MALRQKPDDLGVLGEATLVVLREDDLAVGDDVELPSSAGRDLGAHVERVRELGRETRGPRVIPASGGAVEDLDVHERHVTRGGS